MSPLRASQSVEANWLMWLRYWRELTSSIIEDMFELPLEELRRRVEFAENARAAGIR